MPQPVPQAVVLRLPRYYRCLRELLNNDVLLVKSKELAEMMGITASQVRSDFNYFGDFGRQGYGYNVRNLYKNINAILGITDEYSAVIIGAGELGTVLAGDSMFMRRGVILRGIFDTDEEIIGREIAPDLIVRDITEFEKFCKSKKIDIAVLTKFPEYAEKLIRCGISGIWNFTGVALRNTGDATIQDIYLGDTLMTLCYNMKRNEREK
ncbi:MAG: redox-sensing transcriptional repressor Rex [Oscillospiraceae bacterium]|nr:redox-sensing transcriptional repressor Rex [Oscillospiraceae bacterium]